MGDEEFVVGNGEMVGVGIIGAVDMADASVGSDGSVLFVPSKGGSDGAGLGGLFWAATFCKPAQPKRHMT